MKTYMFTYSVTLKIRDKRVKMCRLIESSGIFEKPYFVY